MGQQYVKVLNTITHSTRELHRGVGYQPAQIMGGVIAFDGITDNIFNPIAHQGLSQFASQVDKEIDLSIQYRQINFCVA